MKKISTSMLEALRVARINGIVNIGDGHIDRGTSALVTRRQTITALRDRGLLTITRDRKAWELTIPGYRALCEAGIITVEMYAQERRDYAEAIEEAHAEALGMERDRMSTEVDAQIPVMLCDHGIDSRRRCPICREDAAEGVPPILTPAVDETEHLGTPKPRKLDTWLTEGMILIDPKTLSGARYRFVDWVRGGAKLVNVLNGGVRVVPQSSVMDWKYIPRPIAQCLVCRQPVQVKDGAIIGHGWRGNGTIPAGTCPGSECAPPRTTLGADQRARCAVKLPRRPGESEPRTCRLTVNADGVCPDVNHRSVGAPDITYDSINAKLSTKLTQVREDLENLAGMWERANTPINSWEAAILLNAIRRAAE